MQNDTKYVLLNDRLKEAKKSLKQKKKNDNMRKTKKKKERGKSKFFEKYQERISNKRLLKGLNETAYYYRYRCSFCSR